MVDVGEKQVSRRVAKATGTVRMLSSTAELIAAGQSRKGDVLGTARIAAIMGTKSTPNLIPMCHPIAIDSVDIEFEIRDSADNMSEVMITATVACHGKTGVEMEALTAVSVAALTVYDMCKSVDRAMEIRDILLLEKSGGKSGEFKRVSSSDGP